MTDWHIRTVRWPDAEQAIAAVRRAVFIDEQGVPEALEWDGLDAHCQHVLAVDAQGQPIGTARLCADGHLGRMAVLRTWRGRGIGTAMLVHLLNVARARRLNRVELNAQTHALTFYAAHGFTAVGAEFPDAGIPHRRMVLHLAPGAA